MKKEKKSFTGGLYYFADRFADWFALLLTGLLFVSSFLRSAYCLDMESQLVLYRWNFLPAQILSLALCALAGAALWNYVKKDVNRRLKLMKWLCVLCFVLTGSALALFGRTVPAADANTTYQIAQNFAAGRLDALTPSGSYLNYYPHQIGLAFLMSIPIRVLNLISFPIEEFHALKILLVLIGAAGIPVMTDISRILWNDPKAEFGTILMMWFCLPYLMYTSFVYGEIPGLVFYAAGLREVLLFLERKGGKRQIFRGLLAVLFLTLSVMVRMNSLVLILAILIVLVFELIRDRRGSILILGCAVTICCFGVLPLTQTLLERKAGTSVGKGVTATSYFAMGMQESSRANGWYNGFNFNTFEEAGLDPEKANAASREAISERLSYFAENPGECLAFYHGKYESTWLDGTIASRQATLASYGGRLPVIESVYTGDAALVWIELGHIWLVFLYGGTFWFLVRRIRHTDERLQVMIPLICLIGGFLFHLLWEANSRYTFPYLMLIVPCAAKGLAAAGTSLRNLQKRRRKD